MTTQPLPAITLQVQDLYTRFPYPPPGSIEGTPVGAVMDYARHIFWPARSDLAGLRVLDAGCGTGTTAAIIARDHPEIEVVGIDLSETSLRHARALADSYGVGTNLELRVLSIEAVDELGKQFDYIIASGVIHHLDNPLRGLRALTEVMAPTGGLSLMVYATYGRTGVYMLQDAMRALGGGADYLELAAMARSLVKRLPAGHPFNAIKFDDVGWEGEAGIVDLLLHVRDRSYTVPQIFDLLDAAGLRPTRFFDDLAYDPATYVQDPVLAARFEPLDRRARATVAELINGRMSKHTVLATRTEYEPFRPIPAGLVLLALRPRLSPLWKWDAIDVVGKTHRKQFRVLEHHYSDSYARQYDFASWQLLVLQECDGIRTAHEVFSLPQVQQVLPGADHDAKLQAFGQMLETLAALEIILCN